MFLVCSNQELTIVLSTATILVIRICAPMKHTHEFRDPIHNFVSVRTDERKVIDSRPFQRLRHIHQLALTYLLYPGATHKRFEHSLGVMHLATEIFDVVTNPDTWATAAYATSSRTR
jgi:HD superfamily phosphohydrolase